MGIYSTLGVHVTPILHSIGITKVRIHIRAPFLSSSVDSLVVSLSLCCCTGMDAHGWLGIRSCSTG
jgi:hypothetical protein